MEPKIFGGFENRTPAVHVNSDHLQNIKHCLTSNSILYSS